MFGIMNYHLCILKCSYSAWVDGSGISSLTTSPIVVKILQMLHITYLFISYSKQKPVKTGMDEIRPMENGNHPEIESSASKASDFNDGKLLIVFLGHVIIIELKNK